VGQTPPLLARTYIDALKRANEYFVRNANCSWTAELARSLSASWGSRRSSTAALVGARRALRVAAQNGALRSGYILRRLRVLDFPNKYVNCILAHTSGTQPNR
jgi:hypothetical protein